MAAFAKSWRRNASDRAAAAIVAPTVFARFSGDIKRSARHESCKESFWIMMASVPAPVYCDKFRDLL